MKVSNTAERLRRIMDSQHLRQVDILQKAAPYCKKYNVRLGKTDLCQYVSGKVDPKQDKLSILGLALNVSEAWLMGYDVPMRRTEGGMTDNESPLAVSDEGDDPVTARIMDIVRQMTPEERSLYLENLKTLLRLQEQGRKPDIQE